MSTQISYAKIASGQTTSGAVGSPEMVPVAIQIGDAITGATISFTASALDSSHPDDPFTDYGALYNTNGAISYAVAADRFIALSPSDWAGVRSFKIVSASSEAADRLIAVIFQSA